MMMMMMMGIIIIIIIIIIITVFTKYFSINQNLGFFNIYMYMYRRSNTYCLFILSL